MINKIKTYLSTALTSTVVTVAMLTSGVLAIAPTVAVSAEGCTNIANKVASGAERAANGTGSGVATCDTGGSEVDGGGIAKLASNIVNLFSIIVGAVAVIMIIYGGFRYITSGGDSNRVGAAKNTLIYAVIGLIIVALAQIIVRFVLTQTSHVTVG